MVICPARSNPPNAGFTLIEMIVAIAILGVLAAIAGPNFLYSLQKAQLNDALLRLEGAIQETQQEAIRRGETCSLVIQPGLSQSVTGNCLITGDRPLKGVQVVHNQSLASSPWTITFDYRGRNQNFNDKGTAVLSIPHSSVTPQCLVMSIGIGLHRMGSYEGDLSNLRAGDCITS